MNPIIDEYDDILAQMAGRLGGIENLLNAFFGFLHRRTDFYVHYERTDFSVGVSPTMGFPKGIAQQMLITAFSKYKMKYYPTSTETQPLPAQKGLVVADIDVGGKANAKALPSELYRLTDEGKQIPVGNGGFAQKYFWTQTLKEVTVYCDVGSCRGKDVKCEITPRRVHLEVKGELIINGDLDDVVVKDESMWNLNISDNSNPQIVLCLEKARKAWWKCVIVGDPEIDTTKVIGLILFKKSIIRLDISKRWIRLKKLENTTSKLKRKFERSLLNKETR